MPTEADDGATWNLVTLKAYIDARYSSFTDHRAETELRHQQRFVEADLRYQQRFDAQQKAIADALVAAEKAVNKALEAADRAVMKAENSAEKRFESVNEFRTTLSDQAANFLTRSEAQSKIDAISERVGDIKTRLDTGDGGKIEKHENTATMIAIGGLAISIVVAVFVGMGLLIGKNTNPPPRDQSYYSTPTSPPERGVTVSPAIITPPH